MHEHTNQFYYIEIIINFLLFLKSKSKQYEIDSLKQNDAFDNQMDLFKINNDEPPTFYDKFKTCIRRKMRERSYD